MTLLAPGSPYLLVADSVLGVMWRLNYLISQYKVILESPLMHPAPGLVELGINRVHVFDSLRISRTIFKVSLHAFRSIFLGQMLALTLENYQVIADNNGFGDDFAFDKGGNAYIAQDTGDALLLVTKRGNGRVLARNPNSTIAEGDAADAFGRTPWDENILYVVANGGIAEVVSGTKIVGGKVLAVDVCALLASQGAKASVPSKARL